MLFGYEMYSGHCDFAWMLESDMDELVCVCVFVCDLFFTFYIWGELESIITVST